jgi:glycosyltransferase involved in cell wall biosynthesis
MNKPLKIAHISGPVRLELGGVVRAILDMAIAQAKAGHDVIVATWDRTDIPDDWVPGKLGVPRVIEIPRPTKLGKLSKNAESTLSRTIKSCDVIHMHTPWELSNASIAKLCNKLGTPYIVSIHGMLDDWSMAQRTLKKKLYLALSARKLLENAFAVHCTAQAELDQSKQWYPKGNGVVVPLLFDIEPYITLPGKQLAQQAFELDPAKPVVLFLSRIHVKKGVHLLIDAAKTLADRGTQAQFLIAGTGDDVYEQELVSQITRLGLQSSVRLLGMVRGTEKVSLYEAADLFALPTCQENFGFVLVEALACNTPAITTKFVDIWPELQESGSSLIIEQSADAFADTIQNMLDDKAKASSMGETGREWVLKTLNPDAVVKRYESLYEEARRR